MTEIRSELEDCLRIEVNQNTMGMNQCMVRATATADSLIEKWSEILEDNLSEEDCKNFILTQKAWQRYVEAERIFLRNQTHRQQGSMWSYVNGSELLELKLNRASVLNTWKTEMLPNGVLK